MRNYYGYRGNNSGETEKKENAFRPRTRLVIDDTTIYEIDMDCYECLKKRVSDTTDKK